jgi:hypothetical protein
MLLVTITNASCYAGGVIFMPSLKGDMIEAECQVQPDNGYFPASNRPLRPAPIKKEKRGARKLGTVKNLGNPTSNIDCLLNNKPNFLLLRIKVFSAPAPLLKNERLAGGRIVPDSRK